MTVSTSRLSYIDCFELFDKALADLKGVRVKFDNYQKANYFRMRLHTARKIDRQDNARTYDESAPMHGRSTYDTIVARIRRDFEGDFVWLYLEKNDRFLGEIESLSGMTEPEPAMEEPAVDGEAEVFDLVESELPVVKTPHLVRRI